jgi:hypothetical protein
METYLAPYSIGVVNLFLLDLFFDGGEQLIMAAFLEAQIYQ